MLMKQRVIITWIESLPLGSIRLGCEIGSSTLPKDTVLDWKNDAGEYAQRIRKWWKPRKDKYPFHGVDICLIVIAQLSSCSVQRVFSNLEKIRKVTGENLKEEMCKIRLLLQVNGYLYELYNGLVLNYVEE